jgi:Ca2+-binding EF-hand superfamily protein
MSRISDDLILERFDSVDINKDGKINIAELELCFQELKLPISKRDIEEYQHLLGDKNVQISKQQFFKFFRSREKSVIEAYQFLNSSYLKGSHEPSDQLNIQNPQQNALAFRNSLSSLGLKASEDEIRQFFHLYDNHKTGAVSYDEFIQYLSSLPTNNPKAAFDEYIFHYSALKYGEVDYATTTLHYSNQSTSPSTLTSGTSVGSSSGITKNTTNQSNPIEYDTTDELQNINSSDKLTFPFFSRQKWLSSGLVQLLSGGFAGIVSRTSTAPIDRVKTIMQAGGPNAPKSFFSGLRTVYAERGWTSFFKGNGVNCFKVGPETGIKMYTFEYFKSVVAEDPGSITFKERFLAGGLAGATSQVRNYVIMYICLFTLIMSVRL